MADEMIDLSRYYIPRSRLIVREMFGAKRVVDTFAPLPSVVAHFHSMGYFPRAFHDTKVEILPPPEEISGGIWD